MPRWFLGEALTYYLIFRYKNMGPGAASGSSFIWNQKGIVATGDSARGSAIELANLNGVGRADYMCKPSFQYTTYVVLTYLLSPLRFRPSRKYCLGLSVSYHPIFRDRRAKLEKSNVCPGGGLAAVQPNLPTGAPPAPTPGST